MAIDPVPLRSPRTPLGREVRVETPEHVAVGYQLADLGSRFTALLIDAAILVASLLVLLVGLPRLVSTLTGALPLWMAGWGMGALILLTFALSWGYFVFFEAYRGGQTPGKRWMRIRVVHDGGYPLSLQGAAIRNLLRAVDSQPAFTWLIGGASMLLHPSTKRLGDLAAGTLVVREQEALIVPEVAAAGMAEVGPLRLVERELAAVEAYVARRETLPAGQRRHIAGKLAQQLHRRVPWDSGAITADDYLVRLHAEEAARRGSGSGGRSGNGNARSVALVRQERAAWDELRELVDRARRSGLRSLPEAELTRFAALYRQTTTDLARARTYGGSAQLIQSLERLVGGAHNLLYRPPRTGWTELRRWVLVGFPSLVRRRWVPIAVAAGIFYMPALIGFGTARLDPGWARRVLPVEMIARAEQGAEREAAGKGYVEVNDVFMPVMASGLIANNVQVTFFAFAGGVLAGVGTVLILVLNGVFLGAVAGIFANQGLSLYLWTFVLPHGVVELTAITIAGGAGLWLGSALLLPGRLTRREALELRGREAVSLIAGTTLLLIVAGIIEGFISPSSLPREVKLGLALTFLVALTAYLGGGRR